MIVLYSGSGAQGFAVGAPAMTAEDWRKLKSRTVRLLVNRDQKLAAKLLDDLPFEVRQGQNYFSDEFSVLHYDAPLDNYVETEKLKSPKYRQAFGLIAAAIAEISPQYIRFIAVGLESADNAEPVPSPTIATSSVSVERALLDAETLLHSRGPVSAVDRAHTAFHGYVKDACRRDGVTLTEDASLTDAFSELRKQHPAFSSQGKYPEHVLRILRSLSKIVDAVNFLRNKGSVAHPNETLLEEPEAMLVLNSIRSLLHYLDAKLRK